MQYLVLRYTGLAWETALVTVSRRDMHRYSWTEILGLDLAGHV